VDLQLLQSISEYDALPEIGHACGHNLIAVSGLAVGLALQRVFQKHPNRGTIIVLGTPAEEGGGGKVELINKSVFDNVDVAMMCHPVIVHDVIYVQFLAMQELKVIYHGKNAHASAAPWEGVNALDAIVMAYNSISCLRQQILPTDRVHGVISEGGVKPNIIPDKTSGEFYLRSKDPKDLAVLKKKVINCFEGAALSTGCRLEINWVGHPYLNLLTNDLLSELYSSNAVSLGIKFLSKEQQLAIPSGSTDMGNVSQVVPSIHPLYAIPGEAVNHTRGFTQQAATPEAHQATWTAAKGLAMTALDLFFQPTLLQQVKSSFKPVLPLVVEGAHTV